MTRSAQIRNAHFLGTKIRNLRKRNNLTMEDLSARCIKVNADSAPSVSYLSMIERGKRSPSEGMLEVIAGVFQKDVDWFLSDVVDGEATLPTKRSRGGISGIALEPGFLFSPEILQVAIPEMLSQTGVSGRQFAHLLIRAHQETNQNNFPDLERAAESVGQKQLPISLDALFEICRSMDLQVEWFDKVDSTQSRELGVRPDTFVRSWFEAPGTIHLNRALELQPARIKYDLAVYIGHKVLHDGDGVRTAMTADRRGKSNLPEQGLDLMESQALNAQDIVLAWRDFECSFFAGALLCPRVPFRRLLERHAHEVTLGETIEVTHSVTMRRMTAVSSYPHWHYFDAYPPGKLNAVYRGNGIPLPWGNMRLVQDPCQHWAVFRRLNEDDAAPSSQISLLKAGDEFRIYCCESLRVENVAGVPQVLCAGLDINPALEAQGMDVSSMTGELQEACASNGGTATITPTMRKAFTQIARILNVAWIERGIEQPVRMICARSGACPRNPRCHD